MEYKQFLKSEFLQEILDALPLLTFVVDADVRIFRANKAASGGLGLGGEEIYLKRGGDVLRCIHSTAVPEGCGRSPSCKDCVVRNAVGEAIRGAAVCRKKTRMTLRTAGTLRDLHLAVSAAPFQYNGETFVALTLEDIGELIQLKGFIPICAGCKRIRNDAEYWESVERYFGARVDVEFSHSICPECKQRLYPELGKK